MLPSKLKVGKLYKAEHWFDGACLFLERCDLRFGYPGYKFGYKFLVPSNKMRAPGRSSLTVQKNINPDFSIQIFSWSTVECYFEELT